MGVIGRSKRLHDLACASTWGWYLPDWPHYRRPMRKDPWFLVASTLAVGVALALALQGRFVFAGIALIVLPSGGGNLRRLIVGIDERDRTYRIRARLEQGN